MVEVAERLLQLFTTQTVQPVRFPLRVTPATAALAEADGNGAGLADWAVSVGTGLSLADAYPQHLPIFDPDRCNGRPVAYHGPVVVVVVVVVVVNANTLCRGDIFAADSGTSRRRSSGRDR